jgi:4-hydroxy-tetrahydrodipicolinate reductase
VPATLTGTIGREGGVPAGTHVVVDVTLPTGTAALIEKLTAHAAAGNKPLPLIIGTTGDLPMDAIRAYATKAPVAISANFSAGVPLVLSMLGACKTGLPNGWTAEVTEIHHTAKKDAPSGTAKRLVEGLAANGVHGLDASQPVPAHALRLGDTVGVHTVFLAGPGERVEVTHTATRREVFAIGALRLANWIATQQPGLYIK